MILTPVALIFVAHKLHLFYLLPEHNSIFRLRSSTTNVDDRKGKNSFTAENMKDRYVCIDD